ncbi:mitochondrial nicotinamide adenine dinucleotide transporter SLC25A51 isoform X2 [Pongo abelii]|uniref:mitochondrial nicotinamide adenine dinucleotide transporter SLC25A51 isoform X2 n=1 Tax=Pongo abelii TaxID=9601 RepID=UPI003006EEBD
MRLEGGETRRRARWGSLPPWGPIPVFCAHRLPCPGPCGPHPGCARGISSEPPRLPAPQPAAGVRQAAGRPFPRRRCPFIRARPGLGRHLPGAQEPQGRGGARSCLRPRESGDGIAQGPLRPGRLGFRPHLGTPDCGVSETEEDLVILSNPLPAFHRLGKWTPGERKSSYQNRLKRREPNRIITMEEIENIITKLSSCQTPGSDDVTG